MKSVVQKYIPVTRFSRAGIEYTSYRLAEVDYPKGNNRVTRRQLKARNK